MIFSHFPESALESYLKMYDILLNSRCKNEENVICFRQECLNELKRKHDLYKTK